VIEKPWKNSTRVVQGLGAVQKPWKNSTRWSKDWEQLKALEKLHEGGSRIGSSSWGTGLQFALDQFKGNVIGAEIVYRVN